MNFYANPSSLDTDGPADPISFREHSPMPTKHAASDSIHVMVQRMSECTHRQTAGHVLLSNVKLLAGRGHILAGGGGG